MECKQDFTPFHTGVTVRYENYGMFYLRDDKCSGIFSGNRFIIGISEFQTDRTNETTVITHKGDTVD